VLYRTGDLVRLEITNGEPLLYYVGRKDFQVKLRGLRIELGEIEHALRSIPSIQDTVVLVDNDQLLAFVLTDEKHKSQGIDGWREALLSQLPDYMVPKVMVMVSAWPLTPNGKIDRTALLALERPDTLTQYVAPRNTLEQDIAQLWQEVLGTGKAGVFDNFFEAGGDSLAAVRLVAGLEIRFNTKLPVASLFGAQTIAQLAHVINNQLAHWSPIVPIQPQGTQTPIFAVHALGAMVLSYEPLARALGKDQPFYGIQAYGFEDDQTPYTDLNEMLEFYVAAIRQQQPQGPYQLIGHSFGGVLAIEIARKLQAQGEQVNFVGLLDTHMPIRYADVSVDHALILKTFAEHNFGVVDVPLRALRLMKPDVMIKTVAERFHDAVSEDFIRSAIDIIRGFQRMMIGFVMEPIDVPVVLFTPQDLATKARGFALSVGLRRNTKTRGWHKISQQLEIIEVPGDHHGLLKVQESDRLVVAIKQAVQRSL
jgi:thioesterase domain-containing protein/acyl carrier protein